MLTGSLSSSCLSVACIRGCSAVRRSSKWIGTGFIRRISKVTDSTVEVGRAEIPIFFLILMGIVVIGIIAAYAVVCVGRPVIKILFLIWMMVVFAMMVIRAILVICMRATAATVDAPLSAMTTFLMLDVTLVLPILTTISFLVVE